MMTNSGLAKLDLLLYLAGAYAILIRATGFVDTVQDFDHAQAHRIGKGFEEEVRFHDSNISIDLNLSIY